MLYSNVMDFEEWLKFGFDQGWIGPPVCYLHDGVPMTNLEEGELDAGYDPCMHIVRLYEDVEQKNHVEQNHSPSQWRAKRFAESNPTLFDPDLYAD